MKNEWIKKHPEEWNAYMRDYYARHKSSINKRRKSVRYEQMSKGEIIVKIEYYRQKIHKLKKALKTKMEK